MNIRLIAVEVGDALKYDTSVNEIGRIAGAVLPFQHDHFPNDSITSQRAQLIYDWIMCLGRHRCTASERATLLKTFVNRLAPEGEAHERVNKILADAGVEGAAPDQQVLRRFDAGNFHSEIILHCRKLYGQKNFFHAVFEAAKVYHNLIRDKSQSDKDGEAMMMNVWDPRNGVLKVTSCQTETDRNVQDGIKFLSAGLMRAIRNPTAHEPALHWPIDEQDATDILAFVSFLLRQHDKAVYVP
ncbi:MAG: TIGR02391 family protein [Fuerstiella sp.]